jgi:hypothetical protein
VLTASRTAESSHRSRPTRALQQDRVTSSKWLPLQQVLAEPGDTLDPHMHRFTSKLTAAIDRA